MAINKQEMKEQKFTDKNIIKAAIVYLVRSKRKDIADLKHSLSLLDANFNDQFNYPVIVFHEDYENLKRKISSNLKEPLDPTVEIRKMREKRYSVWQIK